MTSSARIVFMGSPEFAVPTLRALVAGGHEVALVVAQPDRPAGRGGSVRMPATKQAAVELGIPVYQPETLKDGEALERLEAVRADAFVVAAYGKIIPKAILALPGRGSLNVHGSLLPRWRGASPIEAAILAGDAETGVSIMEVVAKMDAGPVVLQGSLPIPPEATTRTLEPELAELGASLLLEALPGWLAGERSAIPQDEALITYCSLIKKEDGHLKARLTVGEAERAVRAYDPWPGAYVLYRGKRLGIWRARVVPLPLAPSSAVAGGQYGLTPERGMKTRDMDPRAPMRPPLRSGLVGIDVFTLEGEDSVVGRLAVIGRRPAIAFRDGWLVLDEVQREGARRVSGEAFVNGERGTLAPEVTLA